jgi:hypothetical protein
MDTLEARNLNRLRNGKMMLEFAKQKKSYGLALLLTIITGWLGAHRFYLGHKQIGFAYLAVFAIAVLGINFTSGADHPANFIVGLIPMLLSMVVLVEILISYWIVSRENERIKARLSEEYGVQDLKVEK